LFFALVRLVKGFRLCEEVRRYEGEPDPGYISLFPESIWVLEGQFGLLEESQLLREVEGAGEVLGPAAEEGSRLH
jgi:hypothetical protein